MKGGIKKGIVSLLTFLVVAGVIGFAGYFIYTELSGKNGNPAIGGEAHNQNIYEINQYNSFNTFPTLGDPKILVIPVSFNDYKEVIVEDLKQINKLEILQSALKEEIEIKAQWDNFLFKNTQLIQIRGNGIYKLDLDKFEVITSCNEATIIADIETSVEIYDIKEQTEKGWLVMYDREFTSQEYSDMIFKVKDKMKSEMQDEANLKVAKERAEEIIKTNDHYVNSCNKKR